MSQEKQKITFSFPHPSLVMDFYVPCHCISMSLQKVYFLVSACYKIYSIGVENHLLQPRRLSPTTFYHSSRPGNTFVIHDSRIVDLPPMSGRKSGMDDKTLLVQTP